MVFRHDTKCVCFVLIFVVLLASHFEACTGTAETQTASETASQLIDSRRRGDWVAPEEQTSNVEPEYAAKGTILHGQKLLLPFVRNKNGQLDDPQGFGMLHPAKQPPTAAAAAAAAATTAATKLHTPSTAAQATPAPTPAAGVTMMAAAHTVPV
jgi:hypothetical protein